MACKGGIEFKEWTILRPFPQLESTISPSSDRIFDQALFLNYLARPLVLIAVLLVTPRRLWTKRRNIEFNTPPLRFFSNNCLHILKELPSTVVFVDRPRAL